MKLDVIIMGLLVFGAMITGFYAVVNDLASETAYDVEVDQKYEQAFGISNNISISMEESYNKIVGNWSAKKSSAYQIITLVPDAIILVMKMIELPFAIAFDIINALVTQLGLPSWVSIFLLTAVLLVLIFAIINFIRGTG